MNTVDTHIHSFLKKKNNLKRNNLIIAVRCFMLLVGALCYGQQNLAGIWIGDGYSCDSNIGMQEKIRITVSGKFVTATKITGDECVKAGELTWKGNYKKIKFQVEFRVSDGAKTPLRWVDKEVNIVNRNKLKCNGVTYHRHPQKVQVSTNRKAYAQDKNELIVVQYFGLAGNPRDWISIMPQSKPDTDYERSHYQYTAGKYFGELSFDADRPPGKYEVRVYFDNSYLVEERYDFIIEKDRFRAWLWDLKTNELDRLARILASDLDKWIELGDQQLSHASLNLITLRTAKRDAQNATNQSTKAGKVEKIKASLDHLSLMSDVASLKMMLQFVTSPPNANKATSIAFYIANTSRKFAQYKHNKAQIDEAIKLKTVKSFQKARQNINQLEKQIFSE